MSARQIPTGVAWAASAAWMGVIFAFSSLPGGSVPGKHGWIGHFGEYLVLGALYVVALRGHGRGWHVIALAVGLASVYGVTDEFHQSFVPGRVPDVIDWATDTAGAVTGALIASGVLRWRATATSVRASGARRDAA